jgi:hypothetical protein
LFFFEHFEAHRPMNFREIRAMLDLDFGNAKPGLIAAGDVV